MVEGVLEDTRMMAKAKGSPTAPAPDAAGEMGYSLLTRS